jgi:hypothetical protein
MAYELEVCKNAEGSTLAYMSKKGAGAGYRIAGPKGWGGTRTLAKLEISERDLIEFINCFAPEIIPKLSHPTKDE